jgi:hypothetical protein
MPGKENKQVYERYIEILNAQDLGNLGEVVDPERYREICVGITPGWVDLPNAITSFEKVVGDIPDLNACSPSSQEVRSGTSFRHVIAVDVPR